MKTFSLLSLTGLLLICGSHAGLCQRKFSISLNAAPVYGHTDYKSVLVLDPSTIEITQKSYSIGYSFGLMAHYSFSPKWSVSTGLWATKFPYSKSDISYNGTGLMLTPAYSHPFEFAYKVPISINYQSSRKRLSPYFSLGATLNFRSTSYAVINGEEYPIKFGKLITVMPLIGVGVLYRLSDHYTLVAQPTFQYDIQSHASYTYYHAYQLGIQTQLRYSF